MIKIRKYLDTNWFIILYFLSVFIGNAFLFGIFPELNNLPIWLLYITLFVCGSVTCFIGILLIYFIDTKLEKKRVRKNKYKEK